MRNFGSPYGVAATREAQAATKKGKPSTGLRGRIARQRQREREQAIARIKSSGRSPGGRGTLNLFAPTAQPDVVVDDSMTVMDESFEEPTFFEMYRTPVLVVGALGLAFGGYHVAKKKGWL